MRNVKTREGMEFWDKICALKHYGFIHSPDNSSVLKAEGIGNWIDKFEAQGVVDQAQDEINRLRAERNALQQRLTAADELNVTTKAELAWQESDNAELRKRVDVLEGLLRRSQDFVAFVHKCVRRNGEYAPLHRQEMDELNRDLSDYVEPGVPVCEQCRGEGRVGGPAPDEGGGKNCPACDGTGVIEPANEAALKPAEGGGDE